MKTIKSSNFYDYNYHIPNIKSFPLQNNIYGDSSSFSIDENDSFYTSSDKDIIELGIKELIQIGLLEDRSNVIDSCCFRVAKAYPAYFGTYKDIKEMIVLANIMILSP